MSRVGRAQRGREENCDIMSSVGCTGGSTGPAVLVHIQRAHHHGHLGVELRLGRVPEPEHGLGGRNKLVLVLLHGRRVVARQCRRVPVADPRDLRAEARALLPKTTKIG